jgi:TRAP-type C4-dicarboxylate transport system substrate-binding protein
METRTLRLISAMLVGLVLLGMNVAWAQKPIKIKFAAVMGTPGVAPIADIALSWQEEVTKRTNGAITFENYWGGALGAPAAHVDLIKTGSVQAGYTGSLYTISRFPLDSFEYVIPFGPTDYEVVVKAHRQIRSEFSQLPAEWKRENIMLVAKPPQGTYAFLSRVPLRKLEDWKGLKVALIGRYFARWLPPGATAVVRPGPERYDLLKSGISDANLDPIDNAYVFKLNEVSKYFIGNLSPLIACPLSIIMNLTTFNSLPPEHQKIILEAGLNAELKAAKEVLPKFWIKAQREWKEKGLEFIEFREEEKVKWVNTLEDIPAQWGTEMAAQGLPGFEIVKRYQEITGAMGYKWARQWGIKK